VVVYPLVDTTYWYIIALIVLSGWVSVVSLCTALLVKWALIKFVVELEYRVDGLEDRIGSEVKKRAAANSVEARAGKDLALNWANEHRETPAKLPNAFPDLAGWRQGKMVGGK